MTSRPGSELAVLIGDAAFVRLVEAFGGTRLYVPGRMSSKHDIAKAIGIDAARKLSSRFAPDVIRVPLAREEIARHYRAAGESNAQIARRLRITETGVDKLFRRMPAPPVKGSARQLTFLDD